MSLDYATLELLRQNHPAWRLLNSPHAPLIASFLHRVFIAPNVRVLTQSELAEMLEDELYGLRKRLDEAAFPKPALDYLNDWTANEKGWLRKFYRQGSDEPHFDLTPATEKAITWLGTLSERAFVGTESRLLTLFELLKQMTEGSEPNPQTRIAELQKRRDDLDAEIARAVAGQITLLDHTALKDRFQQFTTLARELLSDFREVEHNFRGLDRRVRERIALWDGSKGALLEEIMGERDVIADSDQGRSFHAFWDFLMSSQRQEELTDLLERVLALPPITELKPDPRTRRVHYDWLAAGEHTQRTVALLSQQLRRFLDDQAWLENRRIMELLRHIETRTLVLRDTAATEMMTHNFMTIADIAADIALPMERPLYTPAIKPSIAAAIFESGEIDLDTAALFSQMVIDKAELARHIRQVLQHRAQITLSSLCEMKPLNQGLAELVTYLQLASDTFNSVVDESISDIITWHSTGMADVAHDKQVRLPRIIFVSSHDASR